MYLYYAYEEDQGYNLYCLARGDWLFWILLEFLWFLIGFEWFLLNSTANLIKIDENAERFQKNKKKNKIKPKKP